MAYIPNEALRSDPSITLDVVRNLQYSETHESDRKQDIISIGGAPFGREADFAVVMGKRKAGKSTVLQYIVATALMEDLKGADTLQIRTTPAKGRPVVVFDTEGTREDTARFNRNVMAIAGLNPDKDDYPSNLQVFRLRGLTKQADCKQAVSLLLASLDKAHLVVIDGISDLVPSVNDETIANETIRFLLAEAERLNCCIVVVIHENSDPNSGGKARGHLGAELERKSSGGIGISKDAETKQHTIYSRYARGTEFDPIAFQFDPESKRPVSRNLTIEERAAMKNQKGQQITKLTSLLQKCFLGVKALNETQLREKLLPHHENPTIKLDSRLKWAKRKFDEAVEEALVVKVIGENGDYYELCDAPVLSVPTAIVTAEMFPEVLAEEEVPF